DPRIGDEARMRAFASDATRALSEAMLREDSILFHDIFGVVILAERRRSSRLADDLFNSFIEQLDDELSRSVPRIIIRRASMGVPDLAAVDMGSLQSMELPAARSLLAPTGSTFGILISARDGSIAISLLYPDGRLAVVSSAQN